MSFRATLEVLYPASATAALSSSVWLVGESVADEQRNREFTPESRNTLDGSLMSSVSRGSFKL